VELGEVADTLYALPQGEFTAARTEYVKAAKAGGDRSLSTAIGKLRRPTAAAWLVNQLARSRPDELTRLVDLGDRLRAAHHDVDGTAIRELSRERQTLMGSLVAGCRDVGREAGQPVSDAVVRELEEMFTAALAEPAAARALSGGRITSAKDLVDGASGWPDSDPSAQPVARLTRPAAAEQASAPEPGDDDRDGDRGAKPAKVADLAEARRNRAKAELERLEAEVTEAERASEAAQDAADTATDTETDARTAVARLRAELSDAEVAEKQAREQARTARRGHDDAERAVREARKRRDVAANRLAALGDDA